MPRVYVPRPYRPRQTQRLTLRAGPFVGADERQADPSYARSHQVYSDSPQRATRLVDMIPLQGNVPGCMQRSGLSSKGIPTGASVIQWIGDYPKEDGTFKTVCIADGEIWEPGTITSPWSGAWVKKVSTANLTTASITLSATARVRCIAGNDYLVVSDGTNTPFQWDGTAGGGLTSLTNCPVLYGQPTLHAGKLFAIKNTARGTFVWSEENDYTTGYEAGGYNNAWDFQQTSASSLTHIIGSNAGLHVIREDGYSMIFGSVDSEFVSSATYDAVSQALGSVSPDAAGVWRDRIVFLGNDRKAYVASLSGGLMDFPTDNASYINDISYWNIEDSECVIDQYNGIAYISRYLPTPTVGLQHKIQVLNLKTNEYFGYHRFYDGLGINRMGTVRGSLGQWYLVIVSTEPKMYVAVFEAPGVGQPIGDSDGVTTRRVPSVVVTAPLGRQVPGICTADQVSVRGLFPDATTFGFIAQGTALVGEPASVSPVGSAAVIAGTTTHGQHHVGLGPVVSNEFMLRISVTATASPSVDRLTEISEIEVPVHVQPRDPRRT